MNSTMLRFTLCVLLLASVLSGCSKGRDADQNGESSKTMTQQATEIIGDYGKKPIDSAWETQRIGQERARAIDEALKSE